MLWGTIFSAMWMRNPLATDMLHGTIFCARDQRIGFWEGVGQKINDSHVTRNNLSKFVIWRCKFLKLAQKLATQKLYIKTSAHPCYTAPTFSATLLRWKSLLRIVLCDIAFTLSCTTHEHTSLFSPRESFFFPKRIRQLGATGLRKRGIVV